MVIRHRALNSITMLCCHLFSCSREWQNNRKHYSSWRHCGARSSYQRPPVCRRRGHASWKRNGTTMVSGSTA